MSRWLRIQSILFGLALTFIAFGPAARTAATGECVEGMYKVYDGDCVQEDLDSGACTTRLEQTPPSRWCCCDEGYEPYDPKKDDGCGLAVAAKKTAAPPTSLTVLRGVRHNLLQKSDKGKEYVALYSQHAGATSKLLLANPGLALEGAKLIDQNLPHLTKLAKGEPVTIAKSSVDEVRAYLGKVAAAAGQNTELRNAVNRVSGDLANGQILGTFGVTVKN